jgi:hypothetical protein
MEPDALTSARRFRPVLRGMNHSEDVYGLELDAVDDNVRHRRHNKLTGTLFFPKAASVGRGFQRTRCVIEAADCRLRQRRVMLSQVIANTFEVTGRGG